MKRPTEFIPVYDQTQKQAADMVEAMFCEIERLEEELKLEKEVSHALGTMVERLNAGELEALDRIDQMKIDFNRMSACYATLVDEVASEENVDLETAERWLYQIKDMVEGNLKGKDCFYPSRIRDRIRTLLSNFDGFGNGGGPYLTCSHCGQAYISNDGHICPPEDDDE